MGKGQVGLLMGFGVRGIDSEPAVSGRCGSENTKVKEQMEERE
jgi:hypothetical protein